MFKHTLVEYSLFCGGRCDVGALWEELTVVPVCPVDGSGRTQVTLLTGGIT